VFAFESACYPVTSVGQPQSDCPLLLARLHLPDPCLSLTGCLCRLSMPSGPDSRAGLPPVATLLAVRSDGDVWKSCCLAFARFSSCLPFVALFGCRRDLCALVLPCSPVGLPTGAVG